MCGIATLIRWTGDDPPADVLAPMTDLVAHRGPDGRGAAYYAPGPAGWRELPPGEQAGYRVALGHRRLSILDLSDAGRQPMAYRDRLWITYNGEVYNFVELRQELERLGHQFRSHSDTEVVLAAYDQWGLDAFERFEGMWALAILDGPNQRVVFSRDRLGIKPLYLLRGAGSLAAASEIKQFTCLPGVQLRPNVPVLRDYLATGYERQQQTFFADVQPLEPGHSLVVDLNRPAAPSRQPYWFPERITATINEPAQAADAFRRTFAVAVEHHLRSDVPVGCALSGGLDSSSIACLVARLLERPGQRLQTFSVTFPGEPIDERRFVDAIVGSIGAEAHYITPAPDQLLADLDRFIWIHDEPVGGLSQYAGYALARLTRQAGVPVTLNGQGGDEILAGYWQSYFLHLRGLAHSGRWLRLAGHFAGALSGRGNPDLIRQTPIMWRRYRARRDAAAAARDGASDAPGAGDLLARVLAMSEPQRRAYEIRHLFLPRLLKWDDRNYMAFSVEGRYPLLDHRLIELTLAMTPRCLYAGGWTKEPLRRGLSGLVPQEVLRRRSKFGFETPQDAWLCGPLRGTIEALLAADAPVWDFADRCSAQQTAAEAWALAGKRDEPGQVLFRLLMADRWLRCFCSSPAPTAVNERLAR